MISSRVDLKKNTLYINIIGIVNKDQIPEALNEIVKKCSIMKEGYFIINDMSLFRCTSEKELDILCNISAKLSKVKLVNKVVRVLPKDTDLKYILMKKDVQHNLNNIFYTSCKKEAFTMILKLI